jgi:hypothetical protein
LLTLLACICFGTALFGKPAQNVVQFKVAPSQLKPNKSYILMRSNHAKAGLSSLRHTFLKEPSKDEIAAYYAAKQVAFEQARPNLMKQAEQDPKNYPVPTIDNFNFTYDAIQNVFSVDTSNFIEGGEERTVLIEVDPGTYILYGASERALLTCNCLGTVKFVADAGVITNIGSLYLGEVHKKSDLPQLEDNRGKSMGVYHIILGQAVVPATSQSPVPESLKNLPIVAAKFKAVGPFVEPGAQGINRLAPIPGVLEYERGRVIDVPTGRVLD